MYRVVKFFTDLQDGDYAYEVGAAFPREGASATDERIAELASSNNRQHAPLIEFVEDEVKDDVPADEGSPIVAETNQTEESLSEMTTKEIKALATEKGYTITKIAKSDVIEQFLAQQK